MRLLIKVLINLLNKLSNIYNAIVAATFRFMTQSDQFVRKDSSEDDDCNSEQSSQSSAETKQDMKPSALIHCDSVPLTATTGDEP